VGNDYARVRIGVGHPGDRDKVIGYVLHDFSRTDRAWLESMLDAIAGAAGRLAEGHGDRFATDVMRRLQGIQAVRRGAEDDPAALSARSGSRKATPAATPHPASRAERVADAPSQSSTPSANADGTRPAPPQRGGSLADHLKRWLRGRG
jgi:PTH1 family peptidyl-tRNA hydrolase